MEPTVAMLAEQLITVFESCTIFAMLSGLQKKRYGIWSYLGTVGTYFLMLEVSKRLIYPTLISTPVFCFTLILALTIAFYHGTLLQATVNVTVVTVVLFAVEISTAFTIYEGMRVPLGLLESPGIHRTLILALIKTIQFFFLIGACRIISLNRDDGSIFSLAAVLSVSLPTSTIFVFMLNDLRRLSVNHDPSLMLVITLILLYSNLLIYYLVDRAVSHRNTLHKYEITKKLADMQEKHSIQLAEASYTMREIKHDLLNQLNVLSLLLREKEYAEASSYIQSLGSAITDIPYSVQSGSHVLDALLSHKIAFAKEDDIILDIRAAVPENRSVDDVDLCALSGNLIDNALEACKKITDLSVKKEVFFSISYRDGFIYIKCVNPYSGNLPTDLAEIETTKEDKLQHGLGLKSVQRIVRKYNGYQKLLTENQFFEIDVLLFY